MQGRKGTNKDKQRFLEALKKRKGIVTIACKDAGITPMTFYNWQKADSEFYDQSEEIREVEIGIVAEDRMAQAILRGDLNMVRFYLQSRNKKYVRKLETEVIDPTKVLAEMLMLDE